jgi:hypothetical protein
MSSSQIDANADGVRPRPGGELTIEHAGATVPGDHGFPV